MRANIPVRCWGAGRQMVSSQIAPQSEPDTRRGRSVSGAHPPRCASGSDYGRQGKKITADGLTLIKRNLLLALPDRPAIRARRAARARNIPVQHPPYLHSEAPCFRTFVLLRRHEALTQPRASKSNSGSKARRFHPRQRVRARSFFANGGTAWGGGGTGTPNSIR